jgi:DNA invertase Pin-like site-specific DNA recombinase
MMEAAHRGEFQAVVIWSLDRLGRGGIAEVAGMVAKLDAAGVNLASVREPWCDTSGPVRDLLIAVLSWVAAWERSRLIERTRAGMDRARKQGIKLGRPTTEPSLIKTALARVAKGESLAKAADWAGVHPATLRRYRDKAA